MTHYIGANLKIYSVKDKLPVLKEVLFCDTNKWFIGFYSEGSEEWWAKDETNVYEIKDVTHWCYLPDNPNNY